jgi:Zn finger protein HypA/HybF involved in hydrogenase expression
MKKFTKEMHQKRLDHINKNVIILDEWKGNKFKYKYKCKSCNSNFKAFASNMRKKEYRTPCPKCFVDTRADTKRRQSHNGLHSFDEVCNTHIDGDHKYSLVEGQTYINNKHKINIKCSDCGNIFGISLSNFRKNRGCPICNRINSQESRGTKLITEWLTKNNFDFSREVSIDGCKYKKRLRFDYVVYKENGELLLIEYDGEQHFKPFMYGEEALRLQKIKDSIKNSFCNKKRLNLLRIKYDQISKIDEILKENLIL